MGLLINPYRFALRPGTTYTGVTPNTTAAYNAFTVIDRTLILTNGKIVYSLGVFWLNAATGKVKIVKRNSVGNYDVLVDEVLVHPGGNTWVDIVLPTPFPIPGSGDYFMSSYHPTGSQPFNAGAFPRAFKSADQGVAAGVTGFTEDSAGGFPFRWTEAV